jgi:hypothetical protein
MNYYRQVFAKAPHVLEVPLALQDRPMEIIILALDEQAVEHPPAKRDALCWTEDFFAATAGQWAGEPLVREQT